MQYNEKPTGDIINWDDCKSLIDNTNSRNSAMIRALAEFKNIVEVNGLGIYSTNIVNMKDGNYSLNINPTGCLYKIVFYINRDTKHSLGISITNIESIME